jgi:hypothetical protein
MIVIHNIFFMTVLYDTHSHNLRFPPSKKSAIPWHCPPGQVCDRVRYKMF